MMGDDLLPKYSPDKNLRLILINGTYHFKHSVGNSLDNVERVYLIAILKTTVIGLLLNPSLPYGYAGAVTHVTGLKLISSMARLRPTMRPRMARNET